MPAPGEVVYQMSNSIFDELQRSNVGGREASKEGDAVVHTGNDKGEVEKERWIINLAMVRQAVGGDGTKR